ncbi:MAG: sigma-70 family RNA polymerase sigma factor [Armatimonadetes bacterium]|nr:sigma-70 family RNA polymerase sigma factor [Armatimonadota bacterium]CUU36674.1 RNA polymerase sigma-70 factor, ECF subfamily [Armatimonadetes bacterium DC]
MNRAGTVAMDDFASGLAYPTLSDEQLVARAKEGDTDALETLFVRYRQPVFRLVYRSVGNADDAEDIVQEVFLKAFERLHTFREQSRFSTWLMRIALNLCTDRARAQKRHAELLQREAGYKLAWMTHPNPPEPEEVVQQNAFHEAFYTALNRLPEHHRQLIVMRDLEEMEYEQMAEILNTTVGGVKLRVMRARRAFKAVLEPLLRQIGEIE